MGLAAWALAVPFALASGEDVRIHWEGSEIAAGELPGQLGASAAAVAADWAPWAAERGYRAALNADGRVLLLVDEKTRTKAFEEQLALVEETVALVDAMAPLPAERDRTLTTGGVSDASSGGRDGAWSHEWQDDGPALESETIVVLCAKDQASYGAALDRLAEAEPYLQGWVQGAKSLSGFVLERPLFAGFRADGLGSKEWNADGELVHRLTQLLISRRFGVQPYWLKTGIAWRVENELQGSIYCFPYRDEFVYATEHGDWERELRGLHKKVASLEMGALSEWPRGTYRPEHARRAFGLACFVAEHHEDALSGILEDLRKLRDEKGIVRHADGTWERIAGWEASPADQRAVLAAHLGEGFLDELLAFFQRGRKYRPGR
jgi:hypothetical protein